MLIECISILRGSDKANCEYHAKNLLICTNCLCSIPYCNQCEADFIKNWEDGVFHCGSVYYKYPLSEITISFDHDDFGKVIGIKEEKKRK